MHARNRTWPLGSDPAERCRQRTLPVEGGDGSTLSLDFTTGVLDPRLTFTRLSNATFINSSGQVQWAAANEFRNTGWVTSTTPTGWNVTFGTGTTTWNNDGTLTMNTGGSSTRPCINANSFTVSQGIAYTFGYTVVSASGSPQIFNVISSMVAGETLAINGATVGPTTVVQAGDVVSCTFTPTGTTAIPRMGPGVNTGMTNTAMTITRPQMNPGVSLQSYLANSSTTAANNNTPRFDYDPTSIGTPRGLLIEGGSVNLLTYSDASTTGWTGLNVTGSNNNATSPDGTTSATLWTGSGGSSNRAYSTIFSVTSGATYTVSAWFKKPASNGSRYVKIYLLSSTEGAIGWPSNGVLDLDTGTASGTGFTVTAYKDNWYRVVSTGTVTSTTSARVFIAMCTSTGGLLTTTESMLAWGCQAESGSGASSYIPTAASTGNRAADSCYLTDFAGWSAGGNFSTTEGTLFVDQAVTFVGTANYPLGGFSTSNTAGSRFGWQYRQGDSPQGYRGLVNAGYVYELPSGAGWSIPAGTTRFRHAMSCGGGTSAFLRQSLKSSASSGAPTQNNYSDTSTLNISGVAAFTLTQSVFAASVRIARVKYWPRAFTLAELDALTN